MMTDDPYRTLPERISTISTWNRTEHGKLVQVEHTLPRRVSSQPPKQGAIPMIRMIAFESALTLPGRISTISTWNRTEHGKLVQVEETPHGVMLHVMNADGHAIGDVEVFRHEIKQITREPRVKEKGGGK